GNLLSRRRRLGQVADIQMALFIVGHEALQVSNPQRLNLLPHQTAAFAMVFLRAAAPRKSPATINCTNSFTLTPTGQSVVHTGLAHSRQRCASRRASSSEEPRLTSAKL